MEPPDQGDRQHFGEIGAQKHGRSDLPLRDFLLLLHQCHRVVMDGVGDLVTQRSGKLVSILYEIQERIDDVHVAARS